MLIINIKNKTNWNSMGGEQQTQLNKYQQETLDERKGNSVII